METDAKSWRKCFVEQSTRKTPVIFLHTRNKSMAGFAGDDLPKHFKPSSFATLSSYHFNVVGHSLRELRCRMFVFTDLWNTRPGGTQDYFVPYIDRYNGSMN
eukprot:Phypoly_transcript_24040.p1 GENE.Phypoly_transcript_24040~~Phypoly_transcript_24040.p1  ORF type:complete len:102 (+),score=4.71 Phypoly_transcript_24040:2-307(+)